MHYPTNYNYADRKKALDKYKANVLCVVQKKREGLSFRRVAQVCKIPDHSTAHKIYKANRLNHEFTDMSKM
jgi:hypothetical protein